MAVTTNDNIKALLKVYYKDGVENLMFRNSPVLKKLQKNRIEGKSYNFSAMYGRGGAVAGDFTKARNLAASVSKNVEFAVEPGQVFSVYTMNAKEVQASVTKRGAYMKVAGAKMFAASEGFRKTLAASLYGRGYGELCFAPASVSLTKDTAADITLPMDAVMKIDIGSELVIKTSVAGGSTAIKATLTVNAITGTKVNVSPSATYTTAATDVICLAGSMDASGSPLLPVGLGGWLPAVGSRKESSWQTYINQKFFNVERKAAPDRLAGAFYAETESTAIKATLTVNAITGTKVNVSPSATYTTAATDVICLAGSMDASGSPLLPVGLGGWLPAVGSRTGSSWQTYINQKFFNVERKAAPDRLAGAFYAETESTAKKVDAIQALLMQVRRQGSLADIIVLNDEDFLELSAEIATTNTYFTQTSTKESKKASIGFSDFTASFSTNFIENIVDDPYCPKGEFYILDSTAVEFDTLTNTDKIDDGIAGNNAGKPDPMSDDNNGHEEDPYKLIIDDYINVQAGEADVNGPCSEVTLMLFGTFAITNPSNCGHGLFYGANPVSISA